jgi:pimeloyl-ACP methyl ester carboxylesterase
LTPYFQIVAPDLRGFGATDKPPASEGYDNETNAHDLAALMTQLGHEKFHIHGEDRGAEFAYTLAYRATLKYAEFNESRAQKKLTIPVMTIGAPE